MSAQSKNKTHVVAPMIGAAGGALAVTVAVERFGVKREVAAFAGAIVALVASRRASGAARVGLEAAAAAGVCLGIAEIVRKLRPHVIYGNQPSHREAPRQAAPPPDAITRADFDKALQSVQTSTEAQLAEREQAHLATVHDLLDRLRRAEAENKRLRAAKSERPSRDAAVLVPVAHEEMVAANDVSAAADVSETDVDPAMVEHMQAIYASLDGDERRRWSTMVATMPKDDFAQIRAELLQRTPTEAVAYLRSRVFPTIGWAA